MENRSPLFLQGNPFGDSVFFRSHYHPSSPRRVAQHCPAKVKLGKGQQQEPVLGSPSPRREGSIARQTTQPEAASSLEESWPSTESSSLVTAESEEDKQSRAGIAGGSLTSPEVLRAETDWSASPNNVPMDNSIIAKYIQRFRHGQPLSREDRERTNSTESTEFWWLNNSPPSNSITAQDTEQISQGIRALSTGGGVFGGHSPPQLTKFGPLPGRASLSSLPHPSVALLSSGLSSGGQRSDVSQLEPFDQETLHLQERANHLLERSESSSSGPAAVSSDGVGSPSMSDTIEEVSLRPSSTPFCKPTDAQQGGAVMTKQVASAPTRLHQVRVPAFSPIPEDDILYQWRLQRKMEAARESPWPLLSKGKLHFPSICLNRPIAVCNEEADEDRVKAMIPSKEGFWRRAAIPARHPTHCMKTVTGAAVSKSVLNPNRREPISTKPPSIYCPVCPQSARERQHSNPDSLDRGQAQWGEGDGGRGQWGEGDGGRGQGGAGDGGRGQGGAGDGGRDQGGAGDGGWDQGGAGDGGWDQGGAGDGGWDQGGAGDGGWDQGGAGDGGRAQGGAGDGGRAQGGAGDGGQAQGGAGDGGRDQGGAGDRGQAQGVGENRGQRQRGERDRKPDSLKVSEDTGQSCAENLASRSYPEGKRHPVVPTGGKPSGQVCQPERCPHSATEQRGHRFQRDCDKARHDKSSTASSTLPLPRTPGYPILHQDIHPFPGQGHPAPRRYQTGLGQESSSDEAWSPLPEEIGMVHGTGHTECHTQSNLQHVLGQVVSERMFSPPVSKQRSSKKPKIGSHTRVHHLPPSPIPSNRQTPELVTQLLEEAEESDGVEFEEDILLQVLRRQRDWVKEQLREADSRLTVLNEHRR